MAAFDFAADTLDTFLERVAAHEAAPGGGAVAAVAAALAAGLVGMVARFSGGEMPDAPAIADEADRLRQLALQLAGQDAGAYQAVLAARRMPKESPDRADRLRRAVERAAEVPLSIADAAATAATLGARLAREGNANLQG